MSRLGRTVGIAGGAVGLLALGIAPSYADGLQRCLDRAGTRNGVSPTCTNDGGTWVASWPDQGGGVPGGFIALIVLGGLIGLAILAWKVTTAQRLARRSGMDPGLATQMTLLTENGLDATYLASSLRQPATPAAPAVPAAPAAAPAAPARDVPTRLAELKGLLDQGVLTQAEYDARRRAIIDSI